jgi:nitrogen fixation protein FixH
MTARAAHRRRKARRRPRSTAYRITGYHVLAGVVGFFLLVTAVNGVMIYKAVSTFGGVETPDAYRRGLDYNKRIALEQAQTELGWENDVTVSPDNNEILVRLKDRDGAPVTGLNLTGVLSRSATNLFDQPLTLIERSSGLYAAYVAGVEPGNWIVIISAARPGAGDTVFAVRRRLWLKP